MIKHQFSDFSYAINTESAKKGHKEILVCFMYNGTEVLKKVYIPEGPGVSYIFEAKKVIDKEMRSGSLSAYSHKFVAKNKKKGTSHVKKSSPKVVAAVPTGGFSGKKVAAIVVAVALVVGAIAGLATYFLTRPKAPAPISECEVNVDFSQASGGAVDFSGPAKAEIGKQYKANLQLKQELRALNQVDVTVSMDGKPLKNPTDYTFEATQADPSVFELVVKNVTGNIAITPLVKNNSYFVNFTYNGSDVYTRNIIGSGEAPSSIAKSGLYQCQIKVTDTEKYSPGIGVITMGGAILTKDNDYKLEECSPVDPTTKLLTITKPASGNIQIVAQAEENDPSKYPIYFTSYGCTVPSNTTIEVRSGGSYSVKPDAEHTEHTVHVIVAVKNENTGVSTVLTPGNDTYEYDPTQSAGELTIHPEAVTGTIYVTAIAIKDVSIAHIFYDIGDKCDFGGGATATVGNEYSCTITPKTAYTGYEVEIVSVVMNGEPYADYTYSEGTLTITEVTGDIYISAYAKLPESTDHKVSILCDATDITATYNDTVADGATDYGCTIKPKEETTKWVRIVSITMSGDTVTKLVEGEDYTYDRKGVSNYQLSISTPIVGNIIITAIVEDRDRSTFNVEQYIWDCTFNGPDSFTPGLKVDYTGTITPTDLEYKAPKIIAIKVGGTTLTSGSDFTVAETTQGSNVWQLTIPYAKITTDVVIAIGTQPRTRNSFHVTTYSYKCQTSDTTGTVLRDQQYKAKITAIDSDYEPNVFSVIMGDEVLSAGTDYKLDLSATGQYNFTILRTATDDIVICATVKSKTQHLGTPQFQKIGDENKARIIGILPPEGEDKSDITEVEIPEQIEETTSNGVMLDVVQIGNDDGSGADILNGCGNLEKLSIPFIGKNLTPDASKPYDNLFGTIFGTKMYDGCLSLTWQDFYMNSEEDTGSYRIARAAIPSSLSSINITGETSIPQGAFSQCRYIDKITFEKYNTNTIGAYAFAGCSSLRKVDLPDNLESGAKITTIQWRAFEDCATLEKFVLRGIVNVNHHAFNGCIGLSAIEVTNSVAKIESGAFSNLGAALIETEATRTEVTAKVTSADWARDWADATASIIYGFYSSNVFTDGDYRFIRVKIDDGTTTGGYGACVTEYLGDDKEYETITLPATLTGDAIPSSGNDGTYEYPIVEIAAQVFYGYTRLQGVDFTNVKNTLNYIDSYAFTACTSLATLTGIENTKLISIRDYAFDRCPVAGKVTLPSSLKVIGLYTFAYNTAITELDLSATSVSALPERLCYECSALTTVTMPTSTNITSLGNGVFDGCVKLEDLTISASSDLTEIGDNFCNNCKELSNFALSGSSLTRIGNYAFNECTKMNDFNIGNGKNTLLNSVVEIGDYAFGNWTKNNLTDFYIRTGSKLKIAGENIFNNWNNGITQTLHLHPDLVDAYGDYVQKSTTQWNWVMARNQTTGSGVYKYFTAECGSSTLTIYVRNNF